MSDKKIPVLGETALERVLRGIRRHGMTPNSLPHIIGENCSACGACADVCPADALIAGSSCYRINPNSCNGCGRCVDKCPAGAIWW